MFLYRPPERQQVSRRRFVAPSRRREVQTLSFLEKGGLPVDARALGAARRLISDGDGEPEGRREAISIIKSDPGLLHHCMMTLHRLTHDDLDTESDPLTRLERLEASRLAIVLSESAAREGPHRLERAAPRQLEQYEESKIIPLFAEEVASLISIPRREAYLAASLRELGLSLLSWNYPALYAKAMAAHRHEGKDIELECMKLIGLTPTEIGEHFGALWGLSPAIIESLRSLDEDDGDGDLSDDMGEVGATGEIADQPGRSLSRVLGVVSEAAKLMVGVERERDSGRDRGADERWRSFKARYGSVLQGVNREMVREEVSRVLDEVIDAVHLLAPKRGDRESFEEGSLNDPAHELGIDPRIAARTRAEKHPLFERCDEAAQSLIVDIYERDERDPTHREALTDLASRVAPSLGFPRGALFLSDARGERLLPVYRIGQTSLEEYRALLKHVNNGVKECIFLRAPFRASGVGVLGGAVDYMCGPITLGESSGALYLEIRRALSEVGTFPALLNYRLVQSLLEELIGSSR